jgi:hypothetical protein
MYPEPGGLFPFARVIDVHNLNWLTKGPPDKWAVIYWLSDDHEFIRLAGDTCTKFLVKILRKEYNINEIPRFDEP